jgi:hypothetical protein
VSEVRKEDGGGARAEKQTRSTPHKPLSWNLLAEERIRAAQEAGEFDNLPGFGKPIPGIDEPHDELWWVKDKLKREQIASLPPALALRLDVEKTLQAIPALPGEREVRQAVADLNERIRKASFAAWGPPIDVMPLDVEEVVATWQRRKCQQASSERGSRSASNGPERH